MAAARKKLTFTAVKNILLYKTSQVMSDINPACFPPLTSNKVIYTVLQISNYERLTYICIHLPQLPFKAQVKSLERSFNSEGSAKLL